MHEFGPHAFVNVHSGMFAMFAPYDHKKVIPDDSNAKAQVDILHTIQEDVSEPRLLD